MKWKNRIGWAAVILCTIFASLWGFWGILENFHEGWYYENYWNNIALLFIQYIPWSLSFIFLGVISIKYPRIGPFGFLFCCILIPIFLGHNFAFIFIIALPLLVIGVLFYFGRPAPKVWAYTIVILIPILVIIGFGIEPVIRISSRIDDGNYGSRIIEGNGVKLMWAPEGPGWVNNFKTYKAPNWYDASRICRYLREDGESLSDTVQNIWRLPTIDEAVRSLTRNGNNSRGFMDSITGKTSYVTLPDKESPLWKVHSPMIYWWTSTSSDSLHAFRITYNGYTNQLFKNFRAGYLSFRAVKEVK